MKDYGTLRYNSDLGLYEALVSDGKTLVVDADFYAEQKQAGVSEEELNNPVTWENCLDGETIYYVYDRIGK